MSARLARSASLPQPAGWPASALTEFEILDAACTVRRATIKPAMCGHNSLFIGQIGDWTWETVGALCGTDVFGARTQQGWPAYLAFYYFHVRASTAAHLRRFTFGDRIEVISRVFGFGSESVLTLHRIEPAGAATAKPPWFTPAEFYDAPRPDCLYVENFNRWVTRGSAPGNQALLKASPPAFRHEHLPRLDGRYSPRLAASRARSTYTFRDPVSGGADSLIAENFSVEYPLDVCRDFNGVGLVYFAAYFSILDWALLRLWRHFGRSDQSFMNRVVLDHKVCYLGNADVGTTLDIGMTAWLACDDRSEVVDTVIRDRGDRRVIAVSTMQIAAGAAS